MAEMKRRREEREKAKTAKEATEAAEKDGAGNEEAAETADPVAEAEKIAGQASATKVKRARGHGAKAKNGAKAKSARRRSKPRAKS